MKKMMNLVLAATLICGASMFVSCSHDDNPTTKPLSEAIIGKWMIAEENDEPAFTNNKSVVTFVSATKANVSLSILGYDESTLKWSDGKECDVKIEGNTVTLSGEPEKDKIVINELSIKYIDNKEIVADSKRFAIIDGKEEYYNTCKSKYVRVTKDYRKDVLGTWEGRVSSEEGSENDDGELHRWEFKDDGTFVFYFQDENGEWYASNDEFAEYFCDGTLLCTRWKNVGEGTKENREWWEIQSIKNGVMKWYGLRMREDGTTYVASFYMTKVEE